MSDLAKVLREMVAGNTPALSASARRGLDRVLREQRGLALATLAREHRVAPWAISAAHSDIAFAGDDRLAALHDAAVEQTLGTMLRYREMTRLLTLFNNAAVDVVVLKGPAVAQAYYPDPGLRPYGDIDILIDGSDQLAVSRLLRAEGYRERHGREDGVDRQLHACHAVFQHVFRHDETGNLVEVHCDHLQIGLVPVGMADIRARAPVRVFGDGSAGVLAEHDLFLHLCVHLQRHGFGRLIWFKDLDLMIRRVPLNWARIGSDAREQGCFGAVSYTLWLLREMLGTPLPQGAQAIAHGESRSSRFIRRHTWRPADVLSLRAQEPSALRRAVQFAPEEGWMRGGLPSFLFVGRRRVKLRVLAAAISRPWALRTVERQTRGAWWEALPRAGRRRLRRFHWTRWPGSSV